MRGSIGRAPGCERGNTLIEFALVAPVFLLMLLGGVEIAYTMYVRSILVGQLQKAARDLTLEDAADSARQAQIATKIRDAVKVVAPSATVDIDTRSYHDYANVKNPAEEYNDADHDGLCDHGETYIDSNRNGRWDMDGSSSGRGGSKDVVLLTASATYDRLPISRLLTDTTTARLSAKTLLRNQPKGEQAPSGTCQ